MEISATPPEGRGAPRSDDDALRERLRQLPALLSARLGVRVSARAFALSAGSSAQALNGYTKQGRMPPVSLAQGIARAYPYVSLRWLLVGEGEPFAPEGGDLASLVLSAASGRGIAFERLTLDPVPGGIRFDAAGVWSQGGEGPEAATPS